MGQVRPWCSTGMDDSSPLDRCYAVGDRRVLGPAWWYHSVLKNPPPAIGELPWACGPPGWMKRLFPCAGDALFDSKAFFPVEFQERFQDRHRQTKGAETDMSDLKKPRHISTLPSAASPRRLPSRPVYARKLPTLLQCPSRQPWANTGSALQRLIPDGGPPRQPVKTSAGEPRSSSVGGACSHFGQAGLRWRSFANFRRERGIPDRRTFA